MEQSRSSEVSLNCYQLTRHHMPEDSGLQKQYSLKQGSVTLGPKTRVIEIFGYEPRKLVIVLKLMFPHIRLFLSVFVTDSYTFIPS
jgi:hypothetical protein